MRPLPTLTALMVLTAPAVAVAPAEAVGPPAVDSSLVPAPGPAAPRAPTEQARPCVAPTVADSPTIPPRPDLRAAWTRTRGSGQTVAVIDTGVARHRLLPHLLPGGDYVSTGDGTADCDGHGTIIAGIIGAAYDPATGFGGIAPQARILAIRQSSSRFGLIDTPGSSGVGDVESLAAAVRSAADQGAGVINIASVACLEAGAGLDDRALGAALAYAVDVRNAVVVAAAGNVGGDTCPKQNPLPGPGVPAAPDWDRVEVVASPSWYDDLVLTVGSVTADGTPSAFTLAGPWVDIAAPAEGAVSLSPTGDGLVDSMPATTSPQPISGTSYATAMVSGVVALLRSIAPTLTARQVMQRIESTARRPAAGWDPLTGHGVIDVVAALDGLGEPATDAALRQSVPQPADPDTGTGRAALVGTAICVLLSAAAIAAPARSRRRETVADESGTIDRQFGPAR